MRKTTIPSWLGVWVMVWMVGCGGSANSANSGGSGGDTHSGGSGGSGGDTHSGGSGGDTHSGGSGGSGGDTGTTATGDPQTAACQAYCDAIVPTGCTEETEATCVPSCLQAFGYEPPACVDEYGAMLDCAAKNAGVDDCNNLLTACEAVITVHAQCTEQHTCDDTDCTYSDTACSCTGICAGSVPAQIECDYSSGDVQCTCYKDGQVAGTCSGAEAACSTDGCCAKYVVP